MRTGLYCYWGAVGDHGVDAPGHPLYQLHSLEYLAKAFSLQKIYFCSLFKTKVESSISDVQFYIQDVSRRKILNDLQVEIVSLGQAMKLMNSVDEVFLKARFRNKSRLQEGSFDALKFESLLEHSPENRTHIIDSDGELPVNFFESTSADLLTFFLDHSFYSKYSPAPSKITTIAPALVESFAMSLPEVSSRKYDVFFIGNEGLKQPTLSSWLNQLSHDGLRVGVQGKWSPKYDFDVFSRTQRQDAYLQFDAALSTLQVSKAQYREFTFLSPRLYEAGICGIVPFIESGYSCSSPFCTVSSYIDLREKVKCLRDGYSRDYKLIREEQYSILSGIQSQLLSAGSLARCR